MMSDEYAGVIITQFLLYMQSNSVWPCLQFIGDDSQPLTGGEVMALKDEYIKLLTDKVNNNQTL